MPVRRGDLRAVGVVVHEAQRVQKAPHARAQEAQHRAAHGPQHGGLVGVVAAAALHHAEGEHGHQEEGDRLQRREDVAHQVPVARQTDEVVVVRGAQDAGEQREGDDHVDPLVHHLAVDAGGLDQHIGQDGGQDQLPHAFHPQVHHPPPVHLVAHQVVRVDEGEQEQQRQAPQAEHQHRGDGRLAALQVGHAEVEQHGQRHDDDAHLGRQRLLKKLAPHGGQQVVAGHLGQLGIGHQQVTDDGQRAGHQEDPEHDERQLGAVQLGLGLFRHHVVGRPHEAEKQPHDEQIGVHHARHVERDRREQKVAVDVLNAHQHAEDDLSDEQADGRNEVRLGHRLRLVFENGVVGHGGFSCGPDQPSMLGGHFSALMPLDHFRNSTRSSSCPSVRLNCGIWRRPGAPVGCAFIQALMKAPPEASPPRR